MNSQNIYVKKIADKVKRYVCSPRDRCNPSPRLKEILTQYNCQWASVGKQESDVLARLHDRDKD